MKNTEANASYRGQWGTHIVRRDVLSYVNCAIALLVALAGCLYVAWALQRANSQMRAEFLSQVKLFAAAVNTSRLKSLAGTPDDLGRPPYNRIKKQLYVLKQSQADIRFIYIMGRNERGEVFFFLDNEAKDSPDVVWPGQTYPEVSPQIERSIAEWSDMVDGPFRDQWGTWFSALVPIRDPLSGDPIAMLGADIAAKTWYQRLTMAALPGVAVTCLIIAIILIGNAFRQNNNRRKSLPPWLQNVVEPIIVATAGLTVTLFAAITAHQAEKHEQQDAFKQLAENITEHISNNFKIIRFTELEGLASFLQHSPEITRQEFNAYAGQLVRNSLVQAWDLIGIVPHAERQQFEEKMRRENHHDFMIWQPGQDGIKMAANERPFYYPVVFFAPEAGNEGVYGYDLASEPLRLAAINETLRTGLPSATEPIILIQERAEQKSIVVLHPVFTPDGQSVRAFALAAIRLQDLFGSDPEKFKYAHLAIAFHRPDQAAEFLTCTDGRQTATSPYALARPIFASDQVLSINATPSEFFFAAHPLRRGIIVLLGGIFLVVTTTAIVVLLSRHGIELTALVNVRTAELSKSEERFHVLAAQTRTLHWECNAFGLFTAVGSEVNAVFGYEAHELVGKKHVYDLHPLEGRDQFKLQALAAFAEKKAIYEALNPVLTRDGRTILVATSAMPILAPDNTLLGYYGSDRDVTEREIMITELQSSRRAAEAANHAKSQFLTNMSHEIRTPINGIVGVADLLRESGLNPEQAEFVDIINTSSQLLLELINEILDLSRIEAGKLTLLVADFDLQRLLDDISSSLAMVAFNKKIELYCHIDPDTPLSLHGDDFHLRQVLVNLCGNALKFTEQGDICIRVSPAGTRDEQQLIRFSVRDSGIGIPAEQQGHIFETFFQADSSAKRRYGGTGLGLSIVKRLVELMGGTIGFHSQAGIGSEFFFTLPFTTRPQQSHLRSIPAVFKEYRALVIEKNQGLRESLITRLQAWGLTAAPAVSLNDALDILYTHTDHTSHIVVILDLELIATDNRHQALVDLDSMPWSATKIIGMASIGSPQATRFRRNDSIAAFISKPIKTNELLTALVVAIHNPGERPPPPSPETISPANTTGLPATPGAAPTILPPATILLADDNPVNQRVAQAIIKKMGLQADLASNGQEVLALLDKKKYRLVLMDVQMPGMDGLEATRLIRSREAARGEAPLPIIAITAHSSGSDQQLCLDAGMSDYITKPITAQDLRTTIHRWLNRDGQQSSTPLASKPAATH